jgi:hypothetical protein
VDAHPHADLLARRPLMSGNRPLHFDHRRHTGTGRGEHREEPVALGTYLLPAVSGEAGPDEPVVIGESL